MLKYLSPVLLSFLLITSFTGCKDDNPSDVQTSNLVGTWVASETVDDFTLTFTYVIQENGNYTFNVTGSIEGVSVTFYQESGTWEEDEDGDIWLVATSCKELDEDTFELVSIECPEEYFNIVDGNTMEYFEYIDWFEDIVEVDLIKQ